MKMIRTLSDNITGYLRLKSLFEICMVVSILVHVVFYGAWYMKNHFIPVINSDDINLGGVSSMPRAKMNAISKEMSDL